MIEARPDRCQEAAVGFDTYVPCNAPATTVIDWRPRTDPEIRACTECAYHNVRNRNAFPVEAYVPDGCTAEERRSREQEFDGWFGEKRVLALAQHPEYENWARTRSDIIDDTLLAEIASNPPPEPTDKLESLRELCSQLVAVDEEIKDLEARMEDARSRRHALRAVSVPGLMSECGVSLIDLEETAEHPARRVELDDDIGACIAASWSPERRVDGFRYLDEYPAGDLIKTELVVRFPRERRADALALMVEFERRGYDMEVTESAHAGTLSAWLRREIASGASVKLDLIGGRVEKIARVKAIPKRRGRK